MENNKMKALYRKYDLNDSDEELYDKKDMNQMELIPIQMKIRIKNSL